MSRGSFTAIKTEGGLLPREVLERVGSQDPDLPGMDQEDYHIPPSERLGDAINRSWSRLLGLWEAFTEALERRPEGDAAIGLTRDRWLLPLFDELGYGLLQRSKATAIEGKSFAISHMLHRTPVHLVGAGVSIDRRSPGVAGAAAAAPHSLAQEFLNRSDDHLWAFVSNGRLLRILRDNHHLSRQAYVEFDLEAMMEGELFSDFRVLWLVCHKSRVETEVPEECWLETWFQLAREEGVRALDALRDGVEQAIEALGAGFLRHSGNTQLHEALRNGELDRQEYYRELLRLVYRLIFLFVAEDREVLLDPDADAETKRRYTRFYASHRLRDLAARRRGTSHADIWRGLRLVLGRLHDGCPDLGLPALGSFLWSSEATPWTQGLDLSNEDALTALRALCYTEQEGHLLPVSWRTMGSEELGSVYESLLELHPQINREAATFELTTALGHERKTTGSYYTPSSLVGRLIESALEPVLEEAMRSDDPEAALLGLKVCDTAAGSGHFLVAAARRIALRLASVRTGDEEASPEAVTHALRDVVGRCIYGVDLNPLAVELCKVSLWMEALEPGKPLSFLDHHIQLGNSLLGATPHLLRAGIPDDAFKPIEGDDKAFVRDLRARNRKERESEQIGFHTQIVAEGHTRYGTIEALADEVERSDDSTLADIRSKEASYQRLLRDEEYQAEHFVADAWCAAFLWHRTADSAPPITEDVFGELQRNPDRVPPTIKTEVRRLAQQYCFFHFHVAFPDVFRSTAEEGVVGRVGGFDVVLGNPPWERLKFQEKEWFAGRQPEIAAAPNAAKRRRLIASLEESDPELFAQYLGARRKAEGAGHFVRNSNRYPLCGRGDINTYSVFAETDRHILARAGRLGVIVPSGIATDATTQYFFRDLVESEALVSLYDFENRRAIFPGVHRSYKFCLLTVAGEAHKHDAGAQFAFFLQTPQDLDSDERRFQLSAEDIALLNPNTRTCPIFRTKRDAELTKAIYGHVPVLVRDVSPKSNPWGAFYLRLVHYGDHADELSDAWDDGGSWSCAPGWRPVYESKLMHQWDHRYASYTGPTTVEELPADAKEDATLEVQTRYVVSEDFFDDLMSKYPAYHAAWLLAYRDVARSTDERSVIACAIPRGPASVKLPILGFTAQDAGRLLAVFNSFVFDFVARQKLGGISLSYYVLKQLPVPSPEAFADTDLLPRNMTEGWWSERVRELSCTSYSMAGLASDEGAAAAPPFRWDEDRRFIMRCELDAACFHLFSVSREDAAHVLDQFPIVRAREEESHGEFRSRRVILELYDEIAEAREEAREFESTLWPPPADRSLTHSEAPADAHARD